MIRGSQEARGHAEPYGQRTHDAHPAALPGGVGLDAWASRLLQLPGARVIEASAALVAVEVEDNGEPLLVTSSASDGSACGCRAFVLGARCGGCSTRRRRCRHTRQVDRLRRALAAQGEHALVRELRGIAAGTGGESTGGVRSPKREDPALGSPAGARP